MGSSSVTRAGDTKARLVTAAERLFAQNGIDAVSLREINREAGARNAIAVQYHFEDRAGVLRAILAKHRPDIEARRHAMLDQYEADGRPNLRGLASCLVRPLAAKLVDPAGGCEYLQIYAELLERPRGQVVAAPEGEVAEGSGRGSDRASDVGDVRDVRDSINRWRDLVQPLLPRDAGRLHRRFMAIRFAAAELGRRAATGPHTDDRLFVSHLIDLVEGLLAAPVSDETRRLADDRDRTRSRQRSRSA